MSDSIPPPPHPPESRTPFATTPGGRSHGGGWVAFLLVLIFVGAGIFYLRHRLASAPAASASGRAGRGGGAFGPTLVSTAKAQTGDIGIYVNCLGYVTPINSVAVNSRVQGQIMKVYFQEGQMVSAGDPLLDIDPRPNQATLTQAQGQLQRDTAMLADARLDLERYQQAFASNAIPKQQLDTQTALVHQDEGTVQLDQGLLDSAKVQLDYCHLTSPISGRVGLRLVDPGNIVQAGSSNLVVVTQLNPISVIFYVAEDDLPAIQKQLRQGNTLVVEAFDRSLQTKLATGTLATLDNQVDPNTGKVKFRAVFTNEDESLFPNQFVNARLLVETLTAATLLPNQAIQRNGDSAFVYLLAPDQTGTNQTAHMQAITVGTTDGTVSAVEGIDPGTVVISDNFNKLTDGAKVVVRSAGGGSGRTWPHKTRKTDDP